MEPNINVLNYEEYVQSLINSVGLLKTDLADLNDILNENIIYVQNIDSLSKNQIMVLVNYISKTFDEVVQNNSLIYTVFIAVKMVKDACLFLEYLLSQPANASNQKSKDSAFVISSYLRSILSKIDQDYGDLNKVYIFAKNDSTRVSFDVFEWILNYRLFEINSIMWKNVNNFTNITMGVQVKSLNQVQRDQISLYSDMLNNAVRQLSQLSSDDQSFSNTHSILVMVNGIFLSMVKLLFKQASNGDPRKLLMNWELHKTDPTKNELDIQLTLMQLNLLFVNECFDFMSEIIQKYILDQPNNNVDDYKIGLTIVDYNLNVDKMTVESERDWDSFGIRRMIKEYTTTENYVGTKLNNVLSKINGLTSISPTDYYVIVVYQNPESGMVIETNQEEDPRLFSCRILNPKDNLFKLRVTNTSSIYLVKRKITISKEVSGSSGPSEQRVFDIGINTYNDYLIFIGFEQRPTSQLLYRYFYWDDFNYEVNDIN